MAFAGLRRRLDEVVQQRPRIGRHRHAVAPGLVPERLGSKRGHRQPRATGDRAADAHHQPRRVVQRRHAVDRVAARQRGGRRGAERRQRPAAVRDPAHTGAIALAGEHDERQVARASGVRAGTSRVARRRSGRSAPCRSSAAPRGRADRLPHRARRCGPRRAGGERRALRIGDDPRHLAERRLAGDVAVGPSSTETAPSRLIATTTRARSAGCPSARRRARPGAPRSRSSRGRRCRPAR